MDQPGKVVNPARGQLNRKNNIPLSPCVPENLVSRDGFSRPVPRQPAHLHTQTESGAYLRDSSRVPRRRPFMKPPYAIGSVSSLSGHAIAYRWRSLPRVRRHRASKPQGCSERVLPWQITMDQFIFASLSHTHYWYEVGMLKLHSTLVRDRYVLGVQLCRMVALSYFQRHTPPRQIENSTYDCPRLPKYDGVEGKKQILNLSLSYLAKCNPIK